ncbi:MAG: hypothetical protein ABI867_08220 [Kofleriaceae bacterium]
MTTLDSQHRHQIEMYLRRTLTDEDLVTAPSFDDLTDPQIELVASLRPRNLIAPMLYLRAVVPTATQSEAMEFLERVEELHIERQPAQELRDRAIFEHYAGRTLTNAECAHIATVHDMSPAHIELGQVLARKDVTIAFLYLSRIAPDETIEQRHHVAKELAGR